MLRTIQNIKEQKVLEHNNDSNITLSQTPKNNYVCVYVQPHTHKYMYAYTVIKSIYTYDFISI